MADIEKVKEGIKACWSEHWYHRCFDCPYKSDRDNDNTCVERLGADAMTVIREMKKHDTPMPVKNGGTVIRFLCPSCNKGISKYAYGYYGVADFLYHRCPYCGQAIDWSGSEKDEG